MIHNFSASYAGCIVEDNVGFQGTLANDRWYSNEALVQTFDWALDIAQHMDGLGYKEFWMAEHHFQHEGYEGIPNLLMLGLYLATQTQNLRFGCGFNIVPMWHPLRLAEDFAMADILTKGRVIFGVGRGYHTREVETFGAPMLDGDANRSLFEEQVELILKAFREESFSHHGEHFTIPPDVEYRGYDLKDVTLVPRPKHLPVEMWQPIVSGRTIDFIARNGINGVVGLTGETLVKGIFEQYQDANARHGRELELGENLALEFGFYIADTQEEAMNKLRPYHDERYKWFAPFGFVRYADEHGRVWGTPGAPARTPFIEDGVEQKAWICGPAEDFIGFLRDLEDKYPGLEHVILHWAEGMPRAEFMEQLRLFASEVMPAFKG